MGNQKTKKSFQVSKWRIECWEKIIDATVEEFKQNGLKFTMNDLAKRLGISKKTIYTVFESKQAVLVASSGPLCGRFKQYAGRTGGERKSECSAETGEAFVRTAGKSITTLD